MQVHERYTTIATMIVTVLTIIGTAAALGYYLSLTRYSTPKGFFFLLASYLFLIGGTYVITDWRLEYVE